MQEVVIMLIIPVGWYAGTHQCSCDYHQGSFPVSWSMHHTSWTVDDLEQTKVEHWKTQLIWFGIQQQFAKLTVTQQLSSLTQWSLTLASYWTISCPWVCKSLPLPEHTHQLCIVQRPLTLDTLRSLVQVFIHYGVDYCNALLAGLADTQMKQLWYVQNTFSVSSTNHDHASPVLCSFHWLPVW